MRDLLLLHPELLNRYLKMTVQMQKFRLPHMVTCTLRTPDEHKALWAQGRETLDIVNKLRAKVGWDKLTDKENLRSVTWTKKTLHFADVNGYSRAFDLALVYPTTKRPHWDGKASVNDNKMPDYQEVAEIGRSVGLVPGFDFGDPPHFQLPQDVI